MSDDVQSPSDTTPAARIRIRLKPVKTVAMPLRLVLDTNVWLDWLVFADPDVAPIKAAVAAGKAEVFVDEASEAELVRVLAYPFGNKTLTVEAQAACLAECRRTASRYEGGGSERGFRQTCLRTSESANARRDAARRAGIGNESQPLPLCSDPDDQKFLDLALSCRAEFLVTRDRDLLELSRHRDPLPPFRILTPKQFQGVIGDK
jgi:predicted nucleic acid-binding protein